MTLMPSQRLAHQLLDIAGLLSFNCSVWYNYISHKQASIEYFLKRDSAGLGEETKTDF